VSIEVNCPNCGKKLKAPDSAAGKRAKCPGCGSAVKVPEEQVYDAEEVAEEADEYGFMNADDSQFEAVAEPKRRPCPACGEMIVAGAAKCRFCGEVFDETLKRKERKKARQAASAEDSDLTASDWVFCILCSGITCIAGVIYMIQGKPKGLKIFGISLAMVIFWNIVRFVILALAQ
jgi:DNA-directed RNA polymerase subunit M/transcription elongation factor TFIIS